LLCPTPISPPIATWQNILIIPPRALAMVKVANAQDTRTELVRFLTLVLDAIEDEDEA
jgi:hypothetical protein